MMNLVNLISFLPLISFSLASFSVHYHNPKNEPSLVRSLSTELTTPSCSEHVADIYTRLSGHAPLLFEGKLNLQ